MTSDRGQLGDDLQALGVTAGDLLFVHSSFRSLGPVEGGAAAVVAALEDAVGSEGLVLMPSFNLVEPERRASSWDVETTPSTVGWLTEFFRTMPGTVRSDHYSHSVAARGRGAHTFVGDHRSRRGPTSTWDAEPWGCTYGVDSPMHRAYADDGKVLMLGVDYTSSTYAHLVEVLYWHRRLVSDPGAAHPRFDRERLGAFWDEEGELGLGQVGEAECRLFQIRRYVDALLAEVEGDDSGYRST